MDVLGVARIPDPTTAGDFTRRFFAAAGLVLMEAINTVRVKMWDKHVSKDERTEAILDVNGTVAAATGRLMRAPPPRIDRAVSLARKSFKKVSVRGDTDFSLTEHFNRWTEDSIGFAFGMDEIPNLVETAENIDPKCWHILKRRKKARP